VARKRTSVPATHGRDNGQRQRTFGAAPFCQRRARLVHLPWEIAGDAAVIGLSRDGVNAPERRAQSWRPSVIFTWPGGDVAIALTQTDR